MTKREYLALKGLGYIGDINLDEDVDQDFKDVVDAIMEHIDDFWDEVEDEDV